MIQDATAVNRQRQLKIAARRAVRAALKAGTLEQLPCEVCGDLKVDAHHLDYSKQLSVRWLCRRHHSSEHTTRYEIMNRAPQINQLHEGVLEGARTTLRTAIQIGELLIAQKKEVGHGNWIPWMDANLRFSPATSGRYMRCFDKRAELNQSPMTDLTLVEAARVVFKPAKTKERLRAEDSNGR